MMRSSIEPIALSLDSSMFCSQMTVILLHILRAAPKYGLASVPSLEEEVDSPASRTYRAIARVDSYLGPTEQSERGVSPTRPASPSECRQSRHER